MCGRFNRGGRLCGGCKIGYRPLVYSYDLRCRECSASESKQNWVKYTLVAFVSLTVFCVFVILSKFNANTPALHIVILGGQMLTAPVLMRYLMAQYDNTLFRLVAGLLGVWNLDFFRSFYPDMCLNVTVLNALFLDYSIAFYPLFLIFLIYVCCELHSKGYRVVVFAWSPFRKCFLLVKEQWNIKSSLIDVIATFILLAYNKILAVNFDLLVYTRPFNETGSYIGTYLYYDTTIDYFSKEHLPYGITAILILLIFNIFPFLLLFFYPMRCFQRALNHFGFSHLALHTFVDSFTGCYKDGTEPGTRDCRYFASLLLLIRILSYVSLCITKNQFVSVLCDSVLTIAIILYVLFEPYKQQFNTYNKIAVILLVAGLSLLHTSFGFLMSQVMFIQETKYSIIIGVVLAAIPACYVLGTVLHWLWKHSPCKDRPCQRRIQKVLERASSNSTDHLLSAQDERGNQPLLIHQCQATY